MLNHADQVDLPSVGQIVSKRLSIRILIVCSLVTSAIAATVAITNSLANISAIRRDAQALSSQLGSFMEFFDYTPIVNLLNAFTRDRDSPGALVADKNGTLVSSTLNAESEALSFIARARQGQAPAIRFSFQGFHLVAWMVSDIATPDGRALGSVVVGADLNAVLFEVLASVLASSAIAALLLIWLVRVTRTEVAKSLASIGELSAAFSQTESVRQLQAISITPDSREVKSLVDAYQQMVTALRNTASIEVEHERALAIARTTQMLAHDVRKPFSILSMGLSSLAGAKDMQGAKAVIDRLIPEVERALKSVNGLIMDVMEVGSTSEQALLEAVSPDSLIEASLLDIFRLFPHAHINVEYALKHTRMVQADTEKVIRVFLNILSNAVQASPANCQIWVYTRTLTVGDKEYTEFRLGNANSYQSIPRIWYSIRLLSAPGEALTA